MKKQSPAPPHPTLPPPTLRKKNSRRRAVRRAVVVAKGYHDEEPLRWVILEMLKLVTEAPETAK